MNRLRRLRKWLRAHDLELLIIFAVFLILLVLLGMGRLLPHDPNIDANITAGG